MTTRPPPRQRRTRPSRRGGSKKSRLAFWTGLAILLLLAAYLGVIELSRPHVSGDRLRPDTLLRLVESGRIREAKILNQDSIVVGSYTREDSTRAPYYTPWLKDIGSQQRLVDLFFVNGVTFDIDQQFAKTLVLPATLLLPALMVVVILVYLILSYRRGTGLFGVRSGARKASDQSRVTFADVAGQDSAIAELREIRDFLAAPERFSALGAAVPKGILLYGPPGSGKTLLVKALAGEAGCAFFSMSGSDFVELYVGVGAARVRDLFREARQNTPAIVFIDELDSIGRQRVGAGPGGSQSEQEQALNQILAEMDGFSPMEGIIVVGATNRPDVLDAALLRPGRFDRTIGLERPDENGRLAILEVHARGKRFAPDADLEAIARKAIGLNGADLASVVNEGALLAGRAGHDAISQADLEEALRRILEAPERQRRLAMRERSIGRRATTADERVTFADVAGVDEAIEELGEIKDYLAEPARFAEMGARVPGGVLLTGPPGCGKTLLARALAGEANAAFFSASATEFVEMFVGVGASRVRDLFAEARAVAPSIVFIDEIDAIGVRRAEVSLEGHREREQTLNQILIELDGFEARSGVIVMAATNRPDILDPALV
ncbi:MAG: AAA family ATPase, partial [Actinomycetota bacterium]